MKAVKKAGKLANGFERDRGTITHLVEDDNATYGKSLCGTRPAMQWTTVENPQSICKKCLDKVGVFKGVVVQRVMTDEKGYIKEIVFDTETIQSSVFTEEK